MIRVLRERLEDWKRSRFPTSSLTLAVFATSGHLIEDSNLHQSLPGSTGLSPSNTENLPEAEANSQKLLPEQQAGLMGHMKHPNPDYLMP